MMADTVERIRAIVFQDAGQWVAQCIEVDVAAQGGNVDEAVERLEAVLNSEARYTEKKFGKPFAGIDPAPARFQEMWEKCSKSFGPRHSVQVPANGHAQVDLALCA